VNDKQFDLVAFSSVTCGFQVHSPDFVIYGDIHHSVLSIHPTVWLRKIIDYDYDFIYLKLFKFHLMFPLDITKTRYEFDNFSLV
jgi:hypothetical protein